MKSLIRDVLLPATAALAFLCAMAIPAARAQDGVAAPGKVASLAAASSASPPALAASARAVPESGPSTVATAAGPTVRAGPNCGRVERIGKFAIRRCE